MGKKIIFVDDDEALTEGVSEILKEEGFDVLIHDSGSGVVQKVESYRPDLIFLDIWLPCMNGEEIVVQLKESRKTKNIPVILVSAHGNLPQLQKITHAADYLNKPFGIDQLLQKINTYIGNT